MIRYFKELGVTALELLPIHGFVDDKFLLDKGLKNYWGYSSIAFFAPHPLYRARDMASAGITELKEMVKKLHRAGIEVILDVVYNHTAEGQSPRTDARVQGDRQSDLLPPHRRFAPTLFRLHRHGKQLERPSSTDAPADHGFAPLLDNGVPHRRVPLRPRFDARAVAPRRRPALGILHDHSTGSDHQPRKAHCRAVGRRRGRLSSRQFSDRLGGVEWQISRRHPFLLARPRAKSRRARLSPYRLERSLSVERSRAVREHQLHHRARRLFAAPISSATTDKHNEANGEKQPRRR